VGGSGSSGEPQEGSAPDAHDGFDGAVSEAQSQLGEPGAQNLSLPAAGSRDRSPHSGLGDRRDLYPDGARLCVPGGDHGWHSRKVLSWRVSNTLDASFCVEALEAALETYGAPEIFNTDQGSQFTSEDFTGVLKRHGIRISRDGKGRWVDNVFVERWWRSVKYEDVYLKAYDSIAAARASLGRYFAFYNTERRHQSLDRRTPDSVYYETAAKLAA